MSFIYMEIIDFIRFNFLQIYTNSRNKKPQLKMLTKVFGTDKKVLLTSFTASRD